MLVLELCSTTLKQERFKGKICALSSFKKGKEGNEKFKVPKCTETKKFKVRHLNQREWMKGMPIPHLAKSTGAEPSLLSKTHCSHRPKIGKALGEPGRNGRQP